MSLLFLACTTEPPPPPPRVEIAVPMSLSRDPVPSGAIDVAVAGDDLLYVDGREVSDLLLRHSAPVALRVDSAVRYASLFLIVERLGNRPVSLIVAGGSGPAAIPLASPQLQSEGLELLVLMSPEAFIARAAERSENFPGHDHPGLRTWLTELKADHPDSHRATLMPHDQVTTGELVQLADTVRAAGFQTLVLSQAL